MLTKTPSLTPGTQNIAHQKTPVRSQLINQIPISSVQAMSRKLMQKSLRLLTAPKQKLSTKSYPEFTPSVKLPNTQRSTLSEKISTDILPPVKLFPPSERSHIPAGDNLNVPQLKAPIAPVPKLPPQQALLPQDNPFDINSELIPFQDREVEALFKAPELDDFLLPPVLGDQLTDFT